MGRIEDKSVHLIVTSPPYWQLKDYGSKDQIGFDDSYERYINNLNLVWMECHRVLHDGCRMCINIGDQFARSVYYGRYKIIPIRTEIIRFCESNGFDFMGSIIWQKVTTCNTTGGATVMGSFPYPRNGIVKIDYEFILLFKKHGKAPQVDKSIKTKSKLEKEEWNLFFNGHWNFPGEKQKKHIAVFPEELPRRLIKMFSFAGETVLDPFLGSGTTSKVALSLDRNSVGYEINKAFKDTIIDKFKFQSDLFKNDSITFEEDNTIISEDIFNTLPYIFKDPLMFDKKVDPRKLRFGSIVCEEDNGKNRKEYLKVKNIFSADKLQLENDLVVKLLGVHPIRDKEEDAIKFLSENVKGKQVFMKFDTIKYDKANNLLVYLYLKNKTFVNAHLIKRGFAKIDNTYSFSNKTLLGYRV